MKRVARFVPTLAVMLATCLGTATSAAGQALPGSIEVGIGAGRFLGGTLPRGSTRFDGALEADDDILKGVWVGAQVTRDWGIEVGVRRTTTRLVSPASGVFPNEEEIVGFDFTSIEALGLYSLRLGHFLPFVGLGAGIANLDPDTADAAIRDSTRLALSIAGGARFYAARWVGARAEVRGRATNLEGGHWLRTVDLLGGVFLSFGGR